MGFDVRKLAFGVFDQVRLKPVCSASETSYNIEIAHLTDLPKLYFQRVNNKCADQIAWIQSGPLLFACNKVGFSPFKA